MRRTPRRPSAARPHGDPARAHPLGRRRSAIHRAFLRLAEARRDCATRKTLARAVEQSSSLVIITDTRGTIEYVNRRFTEVTGFSAAEVVGQNPRLIASGLTPPEVYPRMWETVLAGKTWKGELVNKAKSGQLYLAEVTISPIVGEDGSIEHIVGTQDDITSRRELESQFRQAQKLESLGMLAGGVAHDFNNLLTAILGYAEFACEQLAENDPVREDVQEIRRTAARAASLTRQLLAFSRRQVISPVDLDVNRLVLDLGKMLGRVVGEHIELVLSPATEPPFVRADPGQLEQVLVNLCVNARDAMPGGGRLEVTVGEVIVTDGAARAPLAAAPGRYASIRVVDTGVGMTDETKSHLFEPFFTTKEKGRGTGLGLATCFGIVKQSGGVIRVTSVLGKGSTFEVLLPRVEGAAPYARSIPPPSSRRPRRELVLLVEDEPTLRGMARRALEGAGYEVVEASSGDEALGLFDASDPGRVALVVTDVVMPRLGGAELVRRLRERRPSLPFVLMSGYVDESVAWGELLDATTTFLQKPFAPAALLAAVGEALERAGAAARG